MSNIALNELVNDVLQKWITVAGIDMSVLSPDKRSWTVSFGGGLHGGPTRGTT